MSWGWRKPLAESQAGQGDFTITTGMIRPHHRNRRFDPRAVPRRSMVVVRPFPSESPSCGSA